MAPITALVTGRAFLEGPRWYECALYVSDMHGDPDGSTQEVDEGLRMANGMVVTGDQTMLLVAESWGKCIVAFDMADDGSLSNRRVWAELADYPDGLGIDAEDGVWVASPVSDRFVRVLAGGEVTATVDTPGRHAIACAVGGADGHELYMLTATTLGERAESRTAMGAVIETTRV